METNEDYASLLLLNEIEERSGSYTTAPLDVSGSTDYRVIHYLKQRIQAAVEELESKTMGGVYNKIYEVLSYGLQAGIVRHFHIDIDRDYEGGVIATCRISLNSRSAYIAINFQFT